MPGALSGAGEAVNVVSAVVGAGLGENASRSTDEPVAQIVPNTQEVGIRTDRIPSSRDAPYRYREA